MSGGVPFGLGVSIASSAAALVAGVLVDRWLGEPARAHPLVGFGRVAHALERRLNPRARARAVPSYVARMLGGLAWALAVLPPVALGWTLLGCLPGWAQWLAQVAMLWFALGGKSLDLHIGPVGQALARGDLPGARALAARVVSRDLSDADAGAVARAAVESALENGSDAVFAALFWFAIGGGPGALAFRLVNTLDAMWGYRSERFLHFGWAAAKIDDLANWAPARLTAASYALLGHRADAWRCWRTQAPAWDSPNAGPVMAAGAGSLRVRLGGAARYHGVIEERPVLGCGAAPVADDVARALRLVRATTWSWLAVSVAAGVLALCVAH